MNEVSNGPSIGAGTKEYVEFVVVSNSITYTCTNTTPPCVDIRGWIFDDNSGYHGTSGIAGGAVRFSQDPLWACIPLGTIILIYNAADKNPAIPADDISMSDGNCKIIAPVSGSLFEVNLTTPGASACSYPSTGWAPATVSSWTATALANGGDCARLVNLSGCEVFSVCYDSDNLNTEIYFSGSGSQKVYYFNDSDPTNQANWTSASASTNPGDQTPGEPNNAANAAYIAQFNNGCQPITPIAMAAISFTNASCSCDGIATANASGSIPGYTYEWFDDNFNAIGQTNATANGLCAGKYKVIAKSLIGCIDSAFVNILSSATVTVSVNSPTICIGQSTTLTATASTTGGSYTWLPSGLTTQSISVNPTTTTSYSISYSLSGCTSFNKSTVTVQESPTITVNSTTLCSGETTTLIANGASTFTWSNGINLNSINVSPTSNTNYTVTGATNGCTNTAIATITVNITPTITVNSSTICSGNSATLTANSASSYLWNDGSTSSQLIVNPIGNTTYSVTGTTNGCTNTAVSNVSVITTTSISVNSTTICSGQSTTLIANGASTYTWSNGSNLNSITINPNSNTNYTVTGNTNNCTNTAIASVSVNITPTVSVNSPSICSGNTTTITANGANTFLWNDGSISSQLIVNPLINTTYSVTGTTNGCTSTTVSNVSVTITPSVTVNSTTVCSGQNTSLLANGANTYTWSNGSNSNPLTISPGATTNYTLIGSNLGCIDTAYANITVLTAPTLTTNNNVNICVGQSATLQVNGGTLYQWDNGAITNTISVNPIVNTTYSVIGSIGTCTTLATANVTVNTPQPISVLPQTICNGQTTTLTANGATTYTWNTGSTSNPTTISPTVTTIYTVTGTKLNCTASTTVLVNVIPSPQITFTSNTIYGCKPLCVHFTDLSANATNTITEWTWNFNDGNISAQQNPYHCFDQSGIFDITLTAKSINGCSKTFTNTNMIHVFPTPTAAFINNPENTDILDPTIEFTNQSLDANSYLWNFGDQSTISNQTSPTHTYKQEGVYTVFLNAKNSYGCENITVHDIIIKGIFTFYAPNTFTPNDDGINNVFYPMGVGWDETTYHLDIYDRWGNHCFSTTDVKKGWNGIANNGAEAAQIDTYIWKVVVNDIFNETHKITGKVTILK